MNETSSTTIVSPEIIVKTSTSTVSTKPLDDVVVNPLRSSIEINDLGIQPTEAVAPSNSIQEAAESHAIDIIAAPPHPITQRGTSQIVTTPGTPELPPLTRSLSDPVTSKEKELTSGEKLVLTAITANMTTISSNIFGKDVVETFFCGVCMENCPIADQHTVSCNDCDRYCRNCLAGWISNQINDGVTAIHCPNYAQCRGNFSEYEISTLVAADVNEKFIRFKAMKLDPNYRECPKCTVGTKVGTEESPRIECEVCSFVFCFSHGTAHPDTDCATYLRTLSVRVRNDLNASSTLVSRITRKCPSCQGPTEKNGGCNHMTCVSCRADWCWLCGSVLGDVTEHYASTATNFSGCAGAQFTDLDPYGCTARYCCCLDLCQNTCSFRLRRQIGRAILLPFIISGYILYAAFGLVFGIAACGITLGCLPITAVCMCVTTIVDGSNASFSFEVTLWPVVLIFGTIFLLLIFGVQLSWLAVFIVPASLFFCLKASLCTSSALERGEVGDECRLCLFLPATAIHNAWARMTNS